MTVNHKHNFLYIWQLRYQLSSFKRSQCFPSSSCMPYIAVVIRIFYLVENLLNSIILIRAKYHQALVTFMQYNIFTYQFAKSTLIEEKCRKFIQFVEWGVGSISPIKCKLISAIWIIGKISSIN